MPLPPDTSAPFPDQGLRPSNTQPAGLQASLITRCISCLHMMLKVPPVMSAEEYDRGL